MASHGSLLIGKRLGAACATLLAAFGTGCAELQALGISDLLETGPLSESTVASGLKEALQVGASSATQELSQAGGFSANPLLRIAMPKKLDTLASSLRSIGLGAKVDEIEDRMNLAAELAAGEALPVFVDAIASMSVADAFNILNGPDDAATEYFKGHTSEALRTRFTPIVENSMKEVGAYRAYNEAKTAYDALPFSKPQVPDLGTYVANRTLDGLFAKIGDEEKKIRDDPAARSTELLRRVFAKQNGARLPHQPALRRPV